MTEAKIRPEAPTHEETMRPKLYAMFKEAGLEITLRCLTDWASHNSEKPPWWMRLVIVQLRTVSEFYEKRHMFQEER